MTDRQRELPETWSDHYAGDDNCGCCWSNRTRTCECGGRLHSRFGDYLDAMEGSYHLEYWCESCGDDGNDRDD